MLVLGANRHQCDRLRLKRNVRLLIAAAIGALSYGPKGCPTAMRIISAVETRLLRQAQQQVI